MGQEKKIVVADDNEQICQILEEFLGDEGYNVSSVHDGYALLAYLKENSPNVIILDLMMPNKDGLSILGTLKLLSPYSRVIIYTGYASYQNSVYARNADKFLVKGCDMQDIIGAVAELS